jgi:outer membrane biosynthesis protein TonB
VPPPAISRTDPPEGLRRSDPPPSFRNSRGSKKVIFGAALIAAASLTIWGVSVRQPSGNATAASVTQASDRPAPAQPSEPKAGAPEHPAAAPAAPAVEPVKPSMPLAALTVAKEAEPPPAKPARGKARAAKAAPATEPQAEVAPAEEAAPAPPLTGNAAAAQEATNAAAQEIDFNKEAARQALEDAGQRAASCRTIDTPAGAARVAVTFSPAGNVTAAVIESGPFVGTAAGGCVASKFKTVRVPAFTGDPITVHKSISF